MHEERKRHQSIALRSQSVSPAPNESQTVEYVTFESNASTRNSPYPQTGPDGQLIYRHRHQSSHNPDKVFRQPSNQSNATDTTTLLSLP